MMDDAAHRESGRAMVEFVFLGTLMLVPLVYLVLILAALQAGAFSATSAAREAGRAFTTASAESEALARGRAAAELSFEDFGVRGSSGVTFACDGSPCLRPDGRVQVTARVTVPMPLVPEFLSGAVPAAVPIEVTHVASVDRFGGASP